MSLTEDFELQIEATCEGRRILWNNNVRIYDEKPTRFLASFRQRTRWAQGHWYVAFKNTGRLFRALVQRRISPLEFLSTFLYLYSLTPWVVLMLQLVLGGFVEICKLAGWIPSAPVTLSAGSWLMMNLPGILLFFYCFVFLFYVAEWMDNHIRPDIRVFIPMLVSMLLNTVVAGWAQVVGLFKHRQQNNWVKTEHSINHLEDLTVRLSDVGLEDEDKDNGISA